MAGAAIGQLPEELVHQILSYLQPSDVVALGLTCRGFCAAIRGSRLGRQGWADLKATTERGSCTRPDAHVAPNDAERWELLRRLDRDLSSHQLCHHCRILHCWPKAGPGAAAAGKKAAAACRWETLSGPRWWNLGELRAQDAYEVLEGRRPLSTLFISTDWTPHPGFVSTDSGRWTTSSGRRYNKLDVEAALLDGSLELHTIQRIWVRGRKATASPGSWSDAAALPKLYHGFQLCRHDRSYMPLARSHMTTTVGVDAMVGVLQRSLNLQRQPARRRSRSPKRGATRSALQMKDWRCIFCPTRSRLEEFDHGSDGIELVLDTWQSLGRWSSPYNSAWSMCWQIHCVTPGAHDCVTSAKLRERNMARDDAHFRYSQWIWSGMKPSSGTWCDLPVGESALGHPSAQVIRDNEKEQSGLTGRVAQIWYSLR